MLTRALFSLSLCLGLAAAAPPVMAEAPAPPAPAEGKSPTPPEPSTEAKSPTRNDFRHELTQADFDSFSLEAAGIRAIKLIIDRRPTDAPPGPRVYFLNSKVYDLHINFLRQNRLITKEQQRTIQLDTWRDENRRFVFAQLARYHEAGAQPRYVLELFDEDKASAKLIAETLPLIAQRLAFGPVSFKPNSMEQESRRAELERLGIPVLANDALNANRLFQVVNVGRPAVGKLRVVTETDPGILENMVFNRNEIVVLQAIPNDITRVAGILTTRPTTPLSHVSLRARTWDIPNVMMRDALNRVYKDGLEDAWVRLEVGADGKPLLRRASEAEVAEAEKARAAAAPVYRIPRADLNSRELVDLFSLRAGDVVRVGAKSANLGELSSMKASLSWDDVGPVVKSVKGYWLEETLGPLPRKPEKMKDQKRAQAFLGKLNVPPGFAIPFSAWQEFLDHAPNQAIKQAIESTLSEPRFAQDSVYRKQRLDALQETIRAGQFPPALGKRILDRIHKDLPDRRLFIRSSTNAEDLEGFNGAGLYETVGNVEGDEAVIDAIKRVWASVWNFKAYEARSDAGIDHRAVYPAILVQQAVKPYAAGVLVTKDALDPSGGYRFYLNANPGFGENTVNTGRGAPEQIYGDPSTGDVKRISLSERGGDLLTDAEVRQLIFFSAVVERHFGRLAGKFPFPQDIEWLVADGQISIVQTRPYLEANGK